MRYTLTFVGTAFSACGYVDQGDADSAVGPIGDYIFGSAIAIGAADWGVDRARLMYTR